MAAQNQEKQTQSKPILKRMNVNFCAAGYYESKPTFAVRKGRPNNPALPPAAMPDKIALKIHPFGIDCPIVLYGMIIIRLFF